MSTRERAPATLESDEPTRPRTRRALLTAAAAAGGALATQALTRPSPVAAADVVLSAVNTAQTATTIRTLEKSTTAKALVGLVMDTGAGGSTAGVQGQSNAANGNGLFGVALSGTTAKGAWGRSANGFGVYGEAIATTGANYGVRGITPSTSGVGVHGLATAFSGSTYGVLGSASSTAGRGVHGANTGQDGTGVFGVASTGGNAKGVHGRSAHGVGVYGEATDASAPNIGVRGDTKSNSVNAIGVLGVASRGYGLFGRGTGDSSSGVRGDAGGNGGYGVWGQATKSSGTGVIGLAPTSGIVGSASLDTGATFGVQGWTFSPNGIGILGNGYPGTGPTVGARGVAYSTTGFGVQGIVSAQSGLNYGVYGQTGSAAGFAGFFVGNTHISGNLSKNGGSFLIDHPQDPANKTLEHSFVEAPERLNVYSGTVLLGATGAATVRLPRYFATLNTDYRYQLTAIGAQAPGLYVAKEIEGNRFTVAGGVPGQKVCWQVTGARQDAWAQRHPLRVERTKRRKDRGKYLNPELFGNPKSAAMHPAPKVPRRPRRLPRPKAT